MFKCFINCQNPNNSDYYKLQDYSILLGIIDQKSTEYEYLPKLEGFEVNLIHPIIFCFSCLQQVFSTKFSQQYKLGKK